MYLFNFIMTLPNTGYVACAASEGALDDPAVILGRNIERFMPEGWTQADLAEKIGKSAAYVSRVISGKTWVSRKVLQKISSALRKSYRDLLDDNGKEPKRQIDGPEITVGQALRVLNEYDGLLSIKLRSKKD